LPVDLSSFSVNPLHGRAFVSSIRCGGGRVLKVLFTTGYTRNAIVHHGRLDPGVEMIGKPFSIDELTRKIRAILDGSA
jgi:DNA-binding response OmpR family regulator